MNVKIFASSGRLGQRHEALVEAVQTLRSELNQWVREESVTVGRLDLAVNAESRSGYANVSCAVWYTPPAGQAPVPDEKRPRVDMRVFHPVMEREGGECTDRVNEFLEPWLRRGHVVTSSELCQAGDYVVLAYVLSPPA